jgi:hypothetical protein
MTDKEAEQIAHGLIQGYIGPDHRVMNMPNSYGARLQALQAAHKQGWNDRAEAEAVAHETLAP